MGVELRGSPANSGVRWGSGGPREHLCVLRVVWGWWGFGAASECGEGGECARGLFGAEGARVAGACWLTPLRFGVGDVGLLWPGATRGCWGHPDERGGGGGRGRLGGWGLVFLLFGFLFYLKQG